MKKQIYGYNWDVTVLEIEKGNSYFDANVEKGKGKVVASSALAQKYELSIGDEFTLKDEETDTLYAFEVTDICQYAPAFYVFMDIDSARDLFGEQDDYYNTIFSNKDLKIPSGRLYAATTKEDIEKSADVFMQMMVSMVITITIVSTLIFILVMYLMMKVMIDRSAYSISLMKVFGFRTREILETLSGWKLLYCTCFRNCQYTVIKGNYGLDVPKISGKQHCMWTGFIV